MANNRRVLSSIKDFLERMKAHDEDIPEEIGKDALEMVEEVKDALEEEEVKEVATDEEECSTKDECGSKDEGCEETKDEEIEQKVEDAIGRALRKYGLIRDGAMESLDELENELGESKESDEDSEEGVIADPEKMNDSAKLRLIRKVKPVIANVKDSRSRKILSDSFVKAMNMNNSTFDYGKLYNIANSNTKDSVSNKVSNSDTDYGMEIAKKYNPHYKEEN